MDQSQLRDTWGWPSAGFQFLFILVVCVSGAHTSNPHVVYNTNWCEVTACGGTTHVLTSLDLAANKRTCSETYPMKNACWDNKHA